MIDQELLAYGRDHGDPYRPSRRRKDAAGGPAVLACWGGRKKADREAEVEARRRPQCRTEAPDRRTSVRQREARVEQHRQRECVERNGGNPPVPPRLFAHGLFTGGDLVALVYLAAFTSMFFTIALLWQAGLGSVPSNLAFSQYHSQSAVSSVPRRATTTPPVRPHGVNRGAGNGRPRDRGVASNCRSAGHRLLRLATARSAPRQQREQRAIHRSEHGFHRRHG